VQRFSDELPARFYDRLHVFDDYQDPSAGWRMRFANTATSHR